MDNFIFSINATLPIFLTMVLGLVFRKIGVFDDALYLNLHFLHCCLKTYGKKTFIRPGMVALYFFVSVLLLAASLYLLLCHPF